MSKASEWKEEYQRRMREVAPRFIDPEKNMHAYVDEHGNMAFYKQSTIPPKTALAWAKWIIETFK